MKNSMTSETLFWYVTDKNNENAMVVENIKKIPEGYIVHKIGSVYEILKYLKNRG